MFLGFSCLFFFFNLNLSMLVNNQLNRMRATLDKIVKSLLSMNPKYLINTHDFGELPILPNCLTISKRLSFVPATLWKHRGHMKKKHNVKAPSSEVPKFISENEPKTKDKHMQVAVFILPEHFCFGAPLNPRLLFPHYSV